MISAIVMAVTAARAPVAVTVDPSIRLVEGIATDGKTIFLSSPTDNVILACRNRCRRISLPAADSRPMGMAWDARRKLLWVGFACPPLATPAACSTGVLRAFDRQGRKRHELAGEGAFQAGDVSASEDGTVLVSDSSSGAVYQLQGGARLAPVLAAYEGKNAQGSAVLADGRLLLADYSRGLIALDRRTGTRTTLLRADGKPLRGIDGIATAGGRVFAIYNGREPGAVLELTVNGDRVDYRELTEGGEFADLTQLAVDGEDLLVISGSGWATIESPGARSQGARVLRIPIPPRP